MFNPIRQQGFSRAERERCSWWNTLGCSLLAGLQDPLWESALKDSACQAGVAQRPRLLGDKRPGEMKWPQLRDSQPLPYMGATSTAAGCLCTQTLLPLRFRHELSQDFDQATISFLFCLHSWWKIQNLPCTSSLAFLLFFICIKNQNKAQKTQNKPPFLLS